jgi:hypothetical protein
MGYVMVSRARIDGLGISFRRVEFNGMFSEQWRVHW